MEGVAVHEFDDYDICTSRMPDKVTIDFFVPTV
jgi:hypothetical protein